MESSTMNFSVGVYFSTTDLATRPWMRMRFCSSTCRPCFCWLGVAEDGDEDDGGFQIAADINVVDGDEADVVDVKFAADGLANRALQKFAHPFVSEIGHD